MRFFDLLLSVQQKVQDGATTSAAMLHLLHGLAEAVVGLCLVVLAIRLGYRGLRSSEARSSTTAFLAILVGLGLAGLVHLFSPGSPPDGASLVEITLTLCAAGASFWAVLLLPQLFVATAKNARVAPEAPLSELKEAHERLSSLYGHLEQLQETRSELLANVSHDLRTPLTLIASPAQRLLHRSDLPDGVSRDLRTISENAALLTRQVNDLSRLASHESQELIAEYATVDVARLVRRACGHFEGLAEEQQTSLVVSAPASLTAELDEDKMERVLVNLLSNAFQVTPEGGVVRCELLTVGDDERVRVLVGDSGPGIREELREAIFERYLQLDEAGDRRAGGTGGLGLAIVKAFVQLHGGRISVDEAPEGGALFDVELPRVAPPGARRFSRDGVRVLADAGFAAAELRPESGGALDDKAGYMDQVRERSTMATENEPTRPRVLVVEDNRDLNRFLCRCLGQEFEVLSAKNGAEGLEMALKERPDCVLTDVMMPIMSGEQLVTALRARDEIEGIPVVVLTARDDDQLRIKLLKEGVQDFITKPFLTDEVLARVRNLVAAKRAADVLSDELATKRMDLETMAREVTRHRHELQTALEQMQVARDLAERASSVKSNFLRMMSHELRTPIAAMQLQLRLMEKTGADKLEDKQREYLARISRSAQRLLDLVNTVLEYARIESGRFEARVKRFSLTKVLEEAVDEYQSHATQKGIRLSLSLTDGDIPDLASDPQVVRLIAVNLVGNGVKHTEEGSVEVGAAVVEGAHTLWVKDTGPGIPREHQMEVFEPFQRFEDIRQLQGAGSGLGLAIVRDMVRAVGGDISLESDVGKGALFRVTLPALPLDDDDEKVSASGSYLHH